MLKDIDSVAKIYDLVKSNNDSKPRNYNNWHASKIGHCPLEHTMLRKGVPTLSKETSGRLFRFEVGHRVEEVIRDYIKEALYKNAVYNWRFDYVPDSLTGELDGYDFDSGTIIEVKSIDPRALKTIKGDVDLRGGEPYWQHVRQTHTYAYMLRQSKMPANNIHYIYVSLDGLIISYKTPVDKGIVKEVSNQIDLLNTAWLKGKMPACICLDKGHPAPWLFGYCQYKDLANHTCCKQFKEQEPLI